MSENKIESHLSVWIDKFCVFTAKSCSVISFQ